MGVARDLLAGFRRELYRSLTRRRDALFEVVDVSNWLGPDAGACP
jgi:hypothetical protein